MPCAPADRRQIRVRLRSRPELWRGFRIGRARQEGDQRAVASWSQRAPIETARAGFRNHVPYAGVSRFWAAIFWRPRAFTRRLSMARRYSRSASKDVRRAMKKRKKGTLRSGRSGKKVKSRKQAIAIGLSEARKKGKKVPRRKRKL